MFFLIKLSKISYWNNTQTSTNCKGLHKFFNPKLTLRITYAKSKRKILQ